VQLAVHKKDRNKWIKMISSRDVGMVPPPSSCMEKPTGGKSIGTRRDIP